jgi:hypothetical protein
VEVLERVFSDPACADVHECALLPHLKLVDGRGRTAETQVARLSLDRPSAERLTWNAIRGMPQELEKILGADGRLWVHPALGR